MDRKRKLLVLAAVVIALTLIQTSLVFACSASGAEHGQGNGNPGGKCEATSKMSENPKCGGTNAGPEDISLINQ